MSYIYEDPLNKGYKQFKLTIKQHNELFPKRKKTWKNKFEYYYNDNLILLHNFVSWLTIMLNVILFPAIVLMNGFINIKEILIDYKQIFNQKKYGSFVSDSISSDTETYDKVMKIIGICEHGYEDSDDCPDCRH